MSKMVLHCNAVEASMEDVSAVILPENHEKFKGKCGKYGTVPHDKLVNAVRIMSNHAFGNGAIDRESFGLSGGEVYPGARFFGLFRFNFDDGAVKAMQQVQVQEVVEDSDEAQVAAIAALDDMQPVDPDYVPNDAGGDNPPRVIPAAAVEPFVYNVMEDDKIFPSFAIRNSYDRTMSVSGALGYECFICDNLALSGEVMFSRKHTRNALEDVLLTFWGLLQTMKEQHTFDLEYRNAAKSIEVNDQLGFELLGRMAGYDLLSFENGNKSQFAVALKEWKKPTHEIFEGRNLWSLHNAVTFAQRNAGIGRRLEAGSNATSIFRSIIDDFEGGSRWTDKATDITSKYKNPTKATILELLDIMGSLKVAVA